MDGNPLPASVVISLSPRFLDTESLGAFAERVKQLPGVTHVAYSQDWIDTLTLVVSYFELGAVVIGTILAVSTVTIIANTIRLSLYTRKEEITDHQRQRVNPVLAVRHVGHTGKLLDAFRKRTEGFGIQKARG